MFFQFNHPLIQLFKTFQNFFQNFLAFYVSLDQNDLTSCKNATNSVCQAFLLLIERRHVLMFVTKIRQRKPHRYDRIGAASSKSEVDALSPANDF